MMRVPGNTPLYVDCDPAGGWVSWSKTSIDGKLAGDITSVDAVQGEAFMSLFQRGLWAVCYGTGGLDPNANVTPHGDPEHDSKVLKLDQLERLIKAGNTNDALVVLDTLRAQVIP